MVSVSVPRIATQDPRGLQYGLGVTWTTEEPPFFFWVPYYDFLFEVLEKVGSLGSR